MIVKIPIFGFLDLGGLHPKNIQTDLVENEEDVYEVYCSRFFTPNHINGFVDIELLISEKEKKVVGMGDPLYQFIFDTDEIAFALEFENWQIVGFLKNLEGEWVIPVKIVYLEILDRYVYQILEKPNFFLFLN